MANAGKPIVIKKYADRLYNPSAGAYVTIDALIEMVEDDEDFEVREAKTGEDITRSVLRQIIVKRGYQG